jgi:hypothetical protein
VNPQQIRGICVPLQSCAFILNIARFQQQNFEAQTFLRQSQCGFNGYYPYVCCPQMTPHTQQQQQQQQHIARTIPIQAPQNLFPKECGVDSGDRIFGGTKTQITEFPWFALLKYSKAGSVSAIFSCAGSLINDRYVITG